MGDKTKIEWSDATWNPTTGCTKVSPGCARCYIERTPPFRTKGRRFEGGTGPHGIGATTGVILHPDRMDQPLRWRRPPLHATDHGREGRHSQDPTARR
jgi:protein gp37